MGKKKSKEKKQKTKEKWPTTVAVRLDTVYDEDTDAPFLLIERTPESHAEIGKKHVIGIYGLLRMVEVSTEPKVIPSKGK